MKPKIFFLATVLFISNLSTAQLLYTEDFESYNTGPFSTDLTGATQAQGGWYTLTNGLGSGTASVNDYKIVADPNKGNVFQIVEGKSFLNSANFRVYRTDLNTYWQQRTAGNNVLKLAFDIYVDPNTPNQNCHISIYNNKELLTNFYFYFQNGSGTLGGAPNRGRTTPLSGLPLLQVKFPTDSWVTAELYIDYDNDKVYFSVPSLNHTVALDTKFPLDLTGGGEHDDNPVKLEIINGYPHAVTNPVSLKIDNINLSAQNFTPTVSINEFVSDKFDLYPNPATDMVTITNSENIGIEEVSVYDITGKIVKLQKSKNENETQLNIEELSSGTYFLHIVTDEGTGIKKLVKK